MQDYYSIVYNNGRLCNSHFDDWCFIGNDKKKFVKHAVPRLIISVPPEDLKPSKTKQENSHEK